MSDVWEPGQHNDKWAAGTNYIWMKQENQELMESNCNSRPNERGYMNHMREL